MRRPLLVGPAVGPARVGGEAGDGFVDLTTEGPANGFGDCLCPPGGYLLVDGRCKLCAAREIRGLSSGLVCPGGAQFGRERPFLQPGYYGNVTTSGLVAVWVCHYEAACPAEVVAGVDEPVRKTGPTGQRI